jgi:hypothetical protein
MVLIAVIAAAPLAVLPAKFAFTQLVLDHGGSATPRFNFLVSSGMVSICYLLAVVIPNVGGVIALTGATVNPFIGFFFPIAFYIKIEQTPMLKSPTKIFAVFVAIIMVAVSILGLAELFSQ